MHQVQKPRQGLFSAVSPDLLDTLYMFCICVACALGFSLRIIGPFYLLIPLVCVLYAIRWTPPPGVLSAYVVLCAFYAALSLFRVFPSSWQIVYVDVAVARQLIPVLSFIAVAWASKVYFEKRRFSGIFAKEALILFLCLVCAPIVMFIQDFRYQQDDTLSSVLAVYGALLNNVTIALFFILGRLFLSRGSIRVLAGATIALIAATTHFIQFRVLAMTALAMLLGLRPRLVAIGVMAGLAALYAIGMYRIPELMVSNPNSGLRIMLISDVLTSLSDTSGIGIGYGTESARWTYHVPGVPAFTFMPDPRTIDTERLLELLSRGVHNSFAQAALRTGLLGACLLVWAFVVAFPARNLPRRLEAHASMMFVTIFLACFVNPGLESPVQLVGIGFVYGYLLALRDWATGRRRCAAGLIRLAQASPLRSCPAWIPMPANADGSSERH